MAYDYTHITSADPNDLGLVDDSLLSFLYGLRHYGYGGDVRESFSRAFERTAIMLSQYKAKSETNGNKMDELIQEFQNSVGKLTNNSELINARIGIDGTVYPTLKARIDAVETNGRLADYVVGETELDSIDLVIKGLDEVSSPFSYDVISTETKNLPVDAAVMMNASDIQIEPAGGGK